MPSNAVLPPNPPGPPRGGNPQNVVDGIMRLLHDQIPSIAAGAVVSAMLLKQAVEVLKRNISALVDILKNNVSALLGGGLIAASLPVLLPSLAVAIVNAVGFTAAGVAKASLAAALQGLFYGGNTGGLFSVLQAFGATGAVAPPVALALGVTSLAVGAGALGYWWYKRGQRLAAEAQAARDGHSDDDEEEEEEERRAKSQQVIKRSTPFNFFNFSRDNSNRY
ncbi:hypothetical protein M413DRAFT_449173 [Hebeloma cylindrosporum]|uniref:Uncharacterized protein n=1 Tax=Hebeloma cylindrosporum TaxID=76867 RepID=A0A0C3BWL7_HEBCY|nr:hypothetical protein M413DRAFT_449173 [Hebeloma cylindrosporum h7]